MKANTTTDCTIVLDQLAALELHAAKLCGVWCFVLAFDGQPLALDWQPLAGSDADN